MMNLVNKQKYVYIIKDLIILASILLGLFLFYPVKAEISEVNPESDKASIIFDGRELFTVGNLDNLTAERRAKRVNNLLREKFITYLDSNEPVKITIVEQSGTKTIRIYNDHLLTVTSRDLITGMTAQEQAEIWQTRLINALENAKKERSNSYIKTGIKKSLIAIIISLTINTGLFFIGRKLRRRELNNSYSNQFSWKLLVIIILQRVIFIVLICYIASIFPWSRIWQYHIFKLISETFSNPMFKFGEDALSLNRILLMMGLIFALWIIVYVLTKYLQEHFLRMVGVDKHLRDSISFFSRYGLIFLGVLLILNAGGINFQSLAIALSVLGVGIGFGLQNIAKDFISGLILIISRPVKVGELVKVGDIEGLVLKIGARTTEISHVDRYIMTVPNSRLIEDPVFNWHRSGLTRIKIYIEVAYGYDIDLIYKILLAAAQVSHPDILRHPPVKVRFRGYGEDSMNFSIVAFTNNPFKQPKVKNHLYYHVVKYLHEYNIKVPFPQRDLNVNWPKVEKLVNYWVKDNIEEDIGKETEEITTEEGNSEYPGDFISGEKTHSSIRLPEPIVQEEYNWPKITEEMRGENGVEIKDRRFGFKVFPKVFLGSDAVDWLVKHEKATRDEAIIIGQLMIEQRIIHHVLDEHDFKDEPLFYRFYRDEDP